MRPGNTVNGGTPTAAPVLAVSSAAAASASLASWVADHAIYFTILAAIAAILSGFAAFVFYIVSVYFKIRFEGEAHARATLKGEREEKDIEDAAP